MAGSAISVQGLSKRYTLGEGAGPTMLRETIASGVRRALGREPAPARETLWALDDVSFEVGRGELLGVVGRNGAGKSTLLKVLARITEPTRGRVELHGRVGSMLEVGTGFHPELTGRENLYLNGAILGMKRREIDAKFDAIVAFADIEDFLDTPVKRYSSGMYVRLAFSVAAYLEPEILLVDEVLAVGDAAFQKKCLGLMGDVAGAGRTVLFVSHNMAAVSQLTSRGLWLEDGRVAAHGPTGEVVQSYLSSLQVLPTTVYDVADAPRPFPELGRQLELVRLELDRVEVPLLEAGSDLHLRLTVRCRRAVPSRFRFGLTIQRIDGMAVGTVFAPVPQPVGEGETATFRLRLPDPRLAPGSYSCAVSVGVGDHLSERREYDVVRDVLHFQVHSDGQGIAGKWYSSWGAIHFEAPEVTRSD